MKIAFDLDGTLYDTLPLMFEVDLRIRRRLGYADISRELYIKSFQTTDWKKFYRDLGIKEEDLERVIKTFVAEFAETELPQLIPHAKEQILEAERSLGAENVYIITNEPINRVEGRLRRDGLVHLLSRVRSPFEGKAKELFELANAQPLTLFAYIGDIVSDGEACLEARGMGAKNVLFYGIVHSYAMNHPDLMRHFVKQNPEFARVLNSLDEVSTIWSH